MAICLQRPTKNALIAIFAEAIFSSSSSNNAEGSMHYSFLLIIDSAMSYCICTVLTVAYRSCLPSRGLIIVCIALVFRCILDP